MEKVFANTNDVHVKTSVVYADADAGHLFAESTKKTKISKADVMDLFLKGMTINLDGKYLKPIGCNDGSSGGVVISAHDGSAAKTFKSAEEA